MSCLSLKHAQYAFVTVMGEPQRFEAYLEQMRERPFLFYGAVPFRHSSSQTYFLSNFYGSNMHFIGRVEHYKQHWLTLLEHGDCGAWFGDAANLAEHADLGKVETGMFHYGFDIDFYRRPSKLKKYAEYIEAMSLDLMLQHGYSLPPVYHLMTRRIYDKIVDFFFQDFVCFGYEYAFEKFVADVKLKEGV